jgi:hypothetical protein
MSVSPRLVSFSDSLVPLFQRSVQFVGKSRSLVRVGFSHCLGGDFLPAALRFLEILRSHAKPTFNGQGGK